LLLLAACPVNMSITTVLVDEGQKAVYLKNNIKIRMGGNTLEMALKMSVLLMHGICLLSRRIQWMVNVLDNRNQEYFHWPTNNM
jgi:hypothetical protein